MYNNKCGIYTQGEREGERESKVERKTLHCILKMWSYFKNSNNPSMIFDQHVTCHIDVKKHQMSKWWFWRKKNENHFSFGYILTLILSICAITISAIVKIKFSKWWSIFKI